MLLPDDDELYARDQIAVRKQDRQRYQMQQQVGVRKDDKLHCYCPASHALFENGIKASTLKKRGIPVAQRMNEGLKLTRNDLERLNMSCRLCETKAN